MAPGDGEQLSEAELRRKAAAGTLTDSEAMQLNGLKVKVTAPFQEPEVADHAGQLQQLHSLREVQHFGAAAAMLSAAATAGKISTEQTLEAAAILGARVICCWEDAGARYDEATDLDRAPAAAAILGTCMEWVAGAAADAAAAIAKSGRPWTQKTAGFLLTAVTRLSLWLLTPLTIVHSASAAATRQHLAALLQDDSHAAIAAQAANPLYRTRLAVTLARHTSRAVYQRSDPEMLPPLALATCAMRMLRGGGNIGGGSRCSCLRTDCDLHTLCAEVKSVARVLCRLQKLAGDQSPGDAILQRALHAKVGQAARQQLLESVTRATDDTASLLARTVLQLVSSCHATHSPGRFLEVLKDTDALLGLAAAMKIPVTLAAICDRTKLVQHEALPTGCLLAAEAAGAAFDIADVVLSKTYTGCPVAAAVPRTMASTGRRAAAQPPRPPPPPPQLHSLSVDALDHLLICGLAAARLRLLGSEPGGRLACNAMFAMAVICVTALPHIAWDVQRSALSTGADPLLRHPHTVSKRLFEIVRDTWRGLPLPASTPLLELAEASCAVLSVALAAEPVMREGLVASGRLGWPKLRADMRAALPDAHHRRLQPMLHQVEDVLSGKCSEVCASVADMEAAKEQRTAWAAAAAQALLDEEQTAAATASSTCRTAQQAQSKRTAKRARQQQKEAAE